jgi:plasmid stabilization system protein ParE
MSLPVAFRRDAESELAEAVDWYEARGRGLGADLLRAVDAALAVIVRNPEAFPVATGIARRVLLRRYPYSLIYIVETDRITIVGCFHSRRDPRRMQTR